MEKCWFCGVEFSEITPSTIEHIIPTSLGGKLKANILCKECNEFFGQTIDSDFNEMLSFITARYSNLISDRNIKPQKECLLTLLNGNTIKVYCKNNLFIPKKPYPDDVNKILYGHKNACKQFKKQPKYSDYEIHEDCTGISAITLDLKNDIFKKSMIKIAINFAIREKIKFDLNFNIKDKQFINLNNVIPYFPQSKLEHYFEIHEDKYNPNYPIHSLKLFTLNYIGNNLHLFCFIELFSTFKCYILLDNNYKGKEFILSYGQKTFIKQEDKSSTKNKNTIDIDNNFKVFLEKFYFNNIFLRNPIIVDEQILYEHSFFENHPNFFRVSKFAAESAELFSLANKVIENGTLYQFNRHKVKMINNFFVKQKYRF